MKAGLKQFFSHEHGNVFFETQIKAVTRSVQQMSPEIYGCLLVKLLGALQSFLHGPDQGLVLLML